MHEHDRELKEALEAYVLGADPVRVTDGVRASIRAEQRTANERTHWIRKENPMKRKKNWTAIAVAAALVVILTAAVAAAPAILNYLNARAVQRDSVSRLTQVPDGWIGVYTIEDLDAIREDLGANYILMADLAFEDGDFEDSGRFPGGWTPIGTYNAPFFGIFNGNGHTIDGLVIRASAEDVFENSTSYSSSCWGLFGYAAYSEYMTVESYDQHVAEDGLDLNGDGIIDPLDQYGQPIRADAVGVHVILDPTKELKHWGGGGIVKNLRLTGGTMAIEYAPVKVNAPDNMTTVSLYAGPVAGYADHVLGCMVEDFSVTVTGTGEDDARAYAEYWERQGFPITMEEPYRRAGLTMIVGGVAGEVYQIDSCAADTAITVRAGEVQTVSRPLVGGLGGVMAACVTSYYDGTISSDAGEYGIGFIRKDDVPRLLPADVMDEIAIRAAFLDNLSYQDGVFTGKVYADDYEAKTEALRKAGVTAATLNEYLDANGMHDGGWQANKLMAFYYKSTAAEVREALAEDTWLGSLGAVSLDMAQSLYTDDINDVTFYVLDPDTKWREFRELSKIITAAFPDGDFEDFCRENHVKYGAYYAYDLREDPECAFEGFDFGTIWTREEGGLPVPRLFK
ncbi:MAG: hypothetical protein IKZ41_05340 [Clostridia bacterium]|nr:hypothetical protein [Clostridia bacterium]MBR5367167.1 hypothetical protein [Clostridia bacterium]